MNKKNKIAIIVILVVVVSVLSPFIIGGMMGDGVLEHVELSTLSHYEMCVVLSGEEGWNEEENSCLFFSEDDLEFYLDRCNRLGGGLKGDVQYTDLQDKNNTSFFECQFPIEIIDT